MSNFPLIRSLQTPNKVNPLPKGHKYSEYNVVVEGENKKVYIPISEGERFQKELETVDEMDKYYFNRIMRDVRGIRG